MTFYAAGSTLLRGEGARLYDFEYQKNLQQDIVLLYKPQLTLGVGFPWRKLRCEPALLFAGAICLTLWITPHAMIYDWSILLIPAVLFWEKRPDCRGLWKVLFALIWAATFFSGPLTLAQLKILPFAVQVSLPILLFAFYNTYRNVVVSG
ncbi:hypothetical protein K0B90_09235 [bacterium]|nr:hypothetical protein [bacterium]